MDPHLSINGQSILVRCLGLEIQTSKELERLSVIDYIDMLSKRQTVAPLQPVRNYKSINLLYAHGCLGC